VNPATGQIVGQVEPSTPHEIAQKVKDAHAAKAAWKALSVERRVELLKPLADAFKKHGEEIRHLTTLEMGKIFTESRDDFNGEFHYTEAFLRDGPGYIADEILVNDKKGLHRIVYEPRGVAICVVAWNFPFTNFMWSVLPNLIVGNTVVIKHSEECILTGKLFERIFHENTQLPKGVFSAVHGGPEVGEQLSREPADLFFFIGSSRTGHKIGQIAAEKNAKVVLEMGGSNPAVVFEDVDVDAVAESVFRQRFGNCGQICDAIKRVIVHEAIFESFVAKMVQRLQELKVGDPNLESTQIGPLAAMRQLELLESQVNDSINAGAHAVIGGKRPDALSGAYFLPTILTGIKTDMRVWREEVFGPVLPIIAFKTPEEAVTLANDTIYGLGSVVFSKDVARAKHVAAQLDAGFVDINFGSHWRTCTPFGGFKASGMGCEHGQHGFRELCRMKVIAE
jgi:succinate-semialdehyde dehydrogenase/glutarate-semialdehyde dehydrogenase